MLRISKGHLLLPYSEDYFPIFILKTSILVAAHKRELDMVNSEDGAHISSSLSSCVILGH